MNQIKVFNKMVESYTVMLINNWIMTLKDIWISQFYCENSAITDVVFFSQNIGLVNSEKLKYWWNCRLDKRRN